MCRREKTLNGPMYSIAIYSEWEQNALDEEVVDDHLQSRDESSCARCNDLSRCVWAFE